MLSPCRNSRNRICEESPPSLSFRGHYHHGRAAHVEWHVPALEHRSEQALDAISGSNFVRRNHHLPFYQIVKCNFLLSCPLDAAPKWLILQHERAASSSNGALARPNRCRLSAGAICIAETLRFDHVRFITALPVTGIDWQLRRHS